MICDKHREVMFLRDKGFVCDSCDRERSARIKEMFPVIEPRGNTLAFIGPRAANDTPSLQEQMGLPAPPDWREAVYDLFQCLERVKVGLNPKGPEVSGTLARHLKIFETVRNERKVDGRA